MITLQQENKFVCGRYHKQDRAWGAQFFSAIGHWVSFWNLGEQSLRVLRFWNFKSNKLWNLGEQVCAVPTYFTSFLWISFYVYWYNHVTIFLSIQQGMVSLKDEIEQVEEQVWFHSLLQKRRNLDGKKIWHGY